MGHVKFYTTSFGATSKIKKDIERIRHMLEAKRVDFEEIDLSMTPERRADMLAHSEGLTLLPQLHVDNKYVGDANTVQELEDFDELDAVLKGK